MLINNSFSTVDKNVSNWAEFVFGALQVDGFLGGQDNMFPSIDNQRRIQAVRDVLNARAIKKPSTDCLIEGVKLCLHNNNVVFANENLWQTNGTATVAPNFCSYADIAVASMDQAIMRQKETAFPEILYFGWYRDDCLVLWNGTDEKLQELYNFINTLNPDLMFPMEIGNQSICFIDLRISIVWNKITTTVYSKPADFYFYLYADSCHKKSSIKGIQKCIAPWLRRIFSSYNHYTAKSKEYTKFLLNMEHDLKSVQQCFNNVGKASRHEALKKVNPRNAENLIVFSASFNLHGSNLNKIINRNIDYYYLIMIILRSFIVPKGTILVVTKKEKNLQQLLMRSDPYNIKDDQKLKEDYGYTKCSYKNCDYCNNFVDETNHIGCNATGRKYKIRRDTTCNSKNVIYAAYCINCMK